MIVYHAQHFFIDIPTFEEAWDLFTWCYNKEHAEFKDLEDHIYTHELDLEDYKDLFE